MKIQQDELLRLVPAAQEGDMDALSSLFEASYHDVYSFALATVKDKELAENITQEACVEVMSTISNLRDPLAFNAWLRRITYHQCTRYFKKRKDVLVDENEDGETIFDTLEDDDIDSLPEEVAERKDLQDIIKDMVDSLPEEQRSALMMYYFDELSVKEISEVQGVSEGTVKSRLNYGRKALMASVEYYERKNGIKLHAIPLFPIFSLLFGQGQSAAMPVDFMVQCVSKASEAGVKAATSVAKTAVEETATSVAKTAVGEAAKSATKTVAKQVAKKTASAVGAKVAAAIISVGVAATATVAVINPNDIVGTVAESVFGIKKKTGVEKAVEKFEKAYNSNDMYKLVECYPPEYQPMLKLELALAQGLGGLFGEDVVGDFFSLFDGMKIELEVLNTEYNESKDRATVTVRASDGETEEIDEVVLIKVGDDWYFEMDW